MTAPDDFPRSPTGRVPQWVHDDMAGQPPPQTAWRTPAGRGTLVGERAPAPTWSGRAPMPAGWSPVVPGRPGRRRRARRRKPRGAAVLVMLAVVGGVWWNWSPENRQAAGDVANALGASVGLPTSWLGAPPRLADDGTRLPPAGQEESPTRLLPVVVPQAVSDQYAFKSPSGDALRPYGWSPCRPVHYVVDVTGAPAGFEESVRVAVDEVSAFTGLLFVNDGVVVEAADPEREPHLRDVYGDRWAPVLIRFADENEVPDLSGDTVGLAGGSAMTSPTTGITHYVSGTVYLDVELLGMAGLKGVPAYLPVLRHELGHLAGLDHVGDPTQIMHPTAGYISTFQAGDITGLSLLGQAACAPDM